MGNKCTTRRLEASAVQQRIEEANGSVRRGHALYCAPPRMMWSVDKQTLKELTLNDMKVTGRSSVFCAILFFICSTLRIIIQFDLL